MMQPKLRKKTSSDPVAVRLQDVERSHPRETIRRGSRLISDKVGMIQHLGHGTYHSQDSGTFGLGIMSSDLSRFSQIRNTSKGGGGGEKLEIALAATIGEAVERYCMFFYDKDDMVFAPYEEVAEYATSPDLVRLFSQEQMPELQSQHRTDYFDEKAPIYWVWGWSHTHQEKRLVPASQVYLNYLYDTEEAAVGRNASTGLAAGLTIEEAILTAIYEIVERDAFTISWLRQRFNRRLEVDDDDLLRLMKERFHADHPSVEINTYEITLDLPIPSIFLTLQRPAEFGPALCVGTATRLDPKAAVRKCLHESGQALPYFRFLMSNLEDWEPRDDYKDVTAFDLHCILYIKRPELVKPALAFSEKSRETVRLSEIENRSTGRVLGDVETCIELLKAQGYEVITVEITTPDMLDVGFRVVRVLIPGLVPLHGNHLRPFLGVERLHTVPQKLGWEPAPVNPFPHPFP